MLITQDQVRELFDYRNGELYWKKYRSSNAQKGDLAGSISKGTGYRTIRINGKSYQAHRVIFLWHHDYLPEFLDHIDGDKLNNNINNLREATKSQNATNSKNTKYYNGKPTSSGFKGVHWHKQREKWQSRISINGKRKHLGLFTSEIKAARSYNRAAIKEYGEFARLNIL